MQVEMRDALEFLYSDSQVGPRPARSMAIDTASGGTTAAHVLLNGLKPGAAVRVSVAEAGKPGVCAEWFRLVDVPVEANTGPVGFVENEGEENKFTARRAPFRVYDAMAPAGSAIKATSPDMALRLHIPNFKNKPGKHAYTIELRHGRETRRLMLSATVRKAAIPPVGKASFPYTNWFSLKLMAERHGLEPWTEPHWRMIKRYAELMAHGRQNTFIISLPDVFTLARGRPVLDGVRLRRLVKLFTGAGMYYIEGGHLAQRTGGEWLAATFDTVLTKSRATSPAGHADLAIIGGQLMEEIERNGWQERWIQHVTDEPIKENAVDYRILTGIARKVMPGLPVLDATMDTGLAGSVDIWCPQAQEFQRRRREFEAMRALGDRVWFYTCCIPGGQWLNRLLDMELLRPALFGWAAALYRLDGFLHWGLNHYRPKQNPFEMNVVPHGDKHRLPAGDTHIVYPGEDGPWSSVRLEAQREGFEDYELLKELRRRRGEKAGAIIRKAVRGFDAYTRDVKTFRAARKALLDALGG